MLRLRSSSVSGFPLTYLNTRIPYLAPGSRWGLPSSRRFSSCMPGANDPDRPSGISPCRNFRSRFVFSVSCLVSRQCHVISTMVPTNDSSVLASGIAKPSPPVSMLLTRLYSLQGGASPLWPTKYSVYASPLLFTSTTVSLPLAALSVRGATLDTGGWLALTGDHPDPPPDRDLHPARSAKLRLGAPQK